MSQDERAGKVDLQELVAEADTGGRKPKGIPAAMLFLVPLAWSLFQLWYASPLPFIFGIFILNDTEARAIHLAFALFLTFTAYPAFKRSPRSHIPLIDWAFALVGAFCGAYLFLFYRELANRPGLPTTFDLVVSLAGVVLLLEAGRRALGPALSAIGIIFVLYIFAGPYLPEMVSHKGASLSRAMSQLWLTTEGVFGVALGVSTSLVFLFVLFGSLLDRAGAGNYFIQLAFAGLGHLRGGPAKAAVVASGLTGVISGSSIANVVTTGTFTIPLMKRVGYPAVKAGAIETSSSVNGQIMPPVMGAAAFLIAEYVGISYTQVVKHAFVPAIIVYVSLFYLVHIEALRMGLEGLEKIRRTSRSMAALRFMMTLCGFIALSGIVYFGVGWTRDVFGDLALPILLAILVAIYVGLIFYRARYDDLEMDDPNAPRLVLPEFGLVARTGLHFLLPVFLLIWCLMIEMLSPSLSAFWATTFLVFIVLTQRPLTALFRGHGMGEQFKIGMVDLVQGLVAGARNMVGVGIATAAAGIIVGTVTLTGVGLILTELVDFLSAGNIILMLLLTAVICIVLGMGMPTTASYVIVATLMAPVIVELASQNDLAVPLIAVHLFVFYFGLMADVTPPVGLASYAAAAISGADPVRTGIQAFSYNIRTCLLPFIFIFNNELILIGVDGVLHGALVIGSALIAMLVFVAATQQWFIVRSRLWESAVLLLVAFTLFRPGFWMDFLYPPYESLPGKEVFRLVEQANPGDFVRLRVKGETLRGDEVEKTVKLRIGEAGTPEQRLRKLGVTLEEDEGKIIVFDVQFRSEAAKLGLDLDFEVVAVEIPADRPPRQLLFIPALLLLGLVTMAQLRRRRKMAALAVAGAR